MDANPCVVSPENLPAELKASHRWLVWKFGTTRSDGKRTKVPLDVKTLTNTDPHQAARYSVHEAVAVQGVDGVGFLSIGEIIGVDFDQCVEDGVVNPEVQQILTRLDTYTELSPSGKGVHCWLYGKAPQAPQDNEKNPLGTNLLVVKRRQIEIYPYSPSSNYLTCTGDRCAQYPANLRRLSDADVDWLYSLFRTGESSASHSDSTTVFTPMSKTKRDEVFNGDFAKYYPGASEAVKALVGTLAIECGGDPEETEREFKKSKLYQDTHWQEKWQRLSKSEIKDAVANARLYLKKLALKQRGETAVERGPDDWKAQFTVLGDWDIPAVEEIAKDLLIKGGTHAFAGLFESYKSMFAMELCAAIRTGRAVADHFPVYSTHEVIYLCPDMPPSLFKKYASYFGLDKDPGFRAERPDTDIFVAIDNPLLQDAVRGRILILDTMLDYARIKDPFKSDEWIGFFQKLRTLIRVHGCVAIVLITHPTKAGARNTVVDPTEFLKDSVTFGGKLDVSLAFRKVDKTSKVFVQRIKGRGFESPLQFTLAHHDENGDSHISWGRFPICDLPENCGDLGEHLQTDKKNGRPSTFTDEIGRQLKELLRQKLSQREISEQLGVGQSTVQRWLKRLNPDLPF